MEILKYKKKPVVIEAIQLKETNKLMSIIAKQAFEDIKNYFESKQSILGVINIENNKKYQEKDIDGIMVFDTNGYIDLSTFEIKADRWYKTGNYFFEIISNSNTNSLGCFLYTEADYIFYYFLEEKELHILPMPQTRDWFIENQHRFEEKQTATKINNTIAYYSIGKLVPRKVLQNEVNNIKILKI